MALGYIPIYNHSFSSNCEYEMDFDSHLILLKAVSFIKPFLKLRQENGVNRIKSKNYFNYNGFGTIKTLWFELNYITGLRQNHGFANKLVYERRAKHK